MVENQNVKVNPIKKINYNLFDKMLLKIGDEEKEGIITDIKLEKSVSMNGDIMEVSLFPVYTVCCPNTKYTCLTCIENEDNSIEYY